MAEDSGKDPEFFNSSGESPAPGTKIPRENPRKSPSSGIIAKRVLNADSSGTPSFGKERHLENPAPIKMTAGSSRNRRRSKNQAKFRYFSIVPG